MSDTITKEEVVMETTQPEQPAQADASTALQDSFWGEKKSPDITQPPTQTNAEPVKQEQPADDEEIVDPNEWVKREFNVDNSDLLKEQLKEYQTLKETKPQEIKYANDESKKLHEAILAGDRKKVLDILAKQDRLEQLSAAELNTQNAADVIKTNMQFKYPDLTQAEIDYKFNKQYSIPSKPVQKADELDEEYADRVSAWEEKKRDIEMDLMIEAKQSRPELLKYKSELVLPDIPTTPNTQSQRQPTPEELATDRKIKDGWLKAATDFSTQFNGFSTVATYKDNGKDVQIPVNYGFSNEEKRVLNETVTKFVESGFDPMAILQNRWIDESGNDKIDQVIKDVSWLLFGEKAAQKFANESHEQRLEQYLKDKKNIRVDGSGGKDFGAGEENKTVSQKLQESFWGN